MIHIPIHFLDEDAELPEEGTYYILARDGIYLRKDNPLFTSIVKLDRITFLEELENSATIKAKPIPAEQVARALLFFRRVYDNHKAEANVLLHYNRETGEYLVNCPRQYVTGGTVAYDMTERFKGFRLVGSFHSHCGGSAFHSSVDRETEDGFDGFHFVIGRVDQPYFNISCMLVVNGQRFRVDPEHVISGIVPVEWRPILGFKRRRVLGKQEADLLGDDAERVIKLLKAETAIPDGQYYDLVLTEGKTYRNVGFPYSWLDRIHDEDVRRKAYGKNSAELDLNLEELEFLGDDDDSDDITYN